MQEKVAKEFGYKTKEEILYVISMIRNADSLYPNNKLICSISCYRKYNTPPAQVYGMTYME